VRLEIRAALDRVPTRAIDSLTARFRGQSGDQDSDPESGKKRQHPYLALPSVDAVLCGEAQLSQHVAKRSCFEIQGNPFVQSMRWHENGLSSKGTQKGRSFRQWKVID
jgi:hypothetical protein